MLQTHSGGWVHRGSWLNSLPHGCPWTPVAQLLLVAASAQAETHRLLTSNSLQAVGVKVARFPSLSCPLEGAAPSKNRFKNSVYRCAGGYDGQRKN